MTILRLLAIFSGIGGAWVATANPVSFSYNAKITTGPVTLACHSGQPVAKVRININGVDQGLPGLLYVAAVAPAQTDAKFFSDGWRETGSGVMPIYAVERAGLKAADIMFPLVQEIAEWNVYVGYGALTQADEQKVRARRVALDRAKERQPNLKPNPITDDHLRATLIQMDMANNTKYRRVFTPSQSDITICEDNPFLSYQR
jgi:hypothetical protein